MKLPNKIRLDNSFDKINKNDNNLNILKTDINDDSNEQINDKDKINKKSNLKKNKKVKFNNNIEEYNNDESNEIDNDIMQKVDAKIATKTGSINSVIDDDKNKGKKIPNKKSKNNSYVEDDSKSIPYYTPHLQPND